MHPAKTTFVRIVDPRLTRQDTRDRKWQLSDFVTVPRLSVIGSFNFGDFLSDDSIRNLLKAYSNAKAMEATTDFRKPSVARVKRPTRRERAMRA